MEDFDKQLATELEQAAELYQEATRLLELCEPSLAQMCQSMLAPPLGTKNGFSPDTLPLVPQHIVTLMCWWARYGDFESVLPEVMPGAKRSGILTSREKPIAKSEFEKCRIQRFGASHPMNWYLECKKKPQFRELLRYECVTEALNIHSPGGWKSFRDLSIDFFDSVTRSIGLQGILRNGQGLTDTDLIELSTGMGLAVAIEPASADTANALRPLVWHSNRSTKMARPAFRVSGRHGDCVFVVARPKSFLCTASKRKDRKTSRASEILIEAAEASWPGDLNFGRGLLRLVGNPDEAICAAAAIKSTAGLLLLAADAEKLHPAATNRLPTNISTDAEVTFLKDLKESLKVGRARFHEARIRPDQGSHRVPSRTTTQENVHFLLRLDGQDCVFGLLVRSDAPDEIFESVLLYDLQAWAIHEVSHRSADPGCKATVAALVQSGCWETSWEATKTAMLALRPDASAEALEHAFSALWPSVLAFRKAAHASKEIPGPQKEQIDKLLRDMVHATLRLLEKTGANTSPPRFCDHEKAGEIDLKRWLAEDHWWQGSHTINLEVCSNAQPRVLEVDALRRLQIQLPGFDERNADDVRLLQLPGVFSWSGGTPPRYVRFIHEHVTRPIIVAFTQGSASPVNFTVALQSLRHAFSDGDGKAAFDDLIKATLKGDDNAVKWLEYLRGDNRFLFECFPRIEKHGDKWKLREPMPEDEHVTWAFDDERVAKTPVAVTYALSPTESVALYSKGRQSDCRELAAADAVKAWCDKVGKSNLGSQLHRATERYWAFGESLNQAVRVLSELLDQIGESGEIGKATSGVEREPEIRNEGYTALKSWLEAIGGVVTPSNWSAKEGGATVTDDPRSLPVAFSATVPAGRVIVDRFGMKALDYEKPLYGALSAGAPFTGYEEIDGISRRYWADHSLWRELAAKWSGIPALPDKKVLAGVLHQIYYALAIEGNVDSSTWHDTAKMRLVSILEDVCGWEAFPPADEAELGHELTVDKVRFFDDRPAVSGSVRVLAKGFCDRRGQILEQAVVLRK